jgi:hypothetical protein
MRDRKIEGGIIKAMLTWSKEQAVNTFFCPPLFCLLNVFAGCFLRTQSAKPAEANGRGKDREIESLT